MTGYQLNPSEDYIEQPNVTPSVVVAITEIDVLQHSARFSSAECQSRRNRLAVTVADEEIPLVGGRALAIYPIPQVPRQGGL
jgi:hypothetical protein